MMKILDKNGRLFGKINIIDATIVILLVTIIAIWAALIKKTVSVDEVYKREVMTVKGEINDLPLHIYKLIKKGDKSIDAELGFYSVVEKIKQAGDVKKIKLSDGTVEEYVNAVIWLKIKAYVIGDSRIYKEIRITNGSSFFFQTKDYVLQLRIIEIIRNNVSGLQEASCEK